MKGRREAELFKIYQYGSDTHRHTQRMWLMFITLTFPTPVSWLSCWTQAFIPQATISLLSLRVRNCHSVSLTLSTGHGFMGLRDTQESHSYSSGSGCESEFLFSFDRESHQFQPTSTITLSLLLGHGESQKPKGSLTSQFSGITEWRSHHP